LRHSLLALAGIRQLPRRHSGLYVAGLEFSISAAIGCVSLFGVCVLDGILIDDPDGRIACSPWADLRTSPDGSRAARAY